MRERKGKGGREREREERRTLGLVRKRGLKVARWRSYVSSGIFVNVNNFRPCLVSGTAIHFEVFSFIFISASLVFSPSLV